MNIQNISELKKELSKFNYPLDDNAIFIGTGSEQVVVLKNNRIIHFIGFGYSKLDYSDMILSIKEMQKYFDRLKRAGVKTSCPDLENVQLYEKPFPLMIIEDNYEGKPVKEYMDKNDADYLIIFKKIFLETLKAVKNNAPMDSSPKNYVINEKEEVIYVDFFIPYTESWLFNKNKNEEYILFTLLNFFIPNCELSIFVSKAIIEKPHMKNQILNIVYDNIDGKILQEIKNKFESKEYEFLLTNHKTLMVKHKEEISNEEIFRKIGYYDKTHKLIIKKDEVFSSSHSIMELYKKMEDNYIARPYNCLLWNKEDIETAIRIMNELKLKNM